MNADRSELLPPGATRTDTRAAALGPASGRDTSRQPWVLRHWLALVNTAVAVFAALPVVAPLLLAAGWRAPALLIYTLYQSACHQWPGRSYFLFGPQLVYSMEHLEGLGVGTAREFVGNAALGFKVAYCERDLAIYTTALLAGLLYALLRARTGPLPWPVFLVCLVPIAIDGFTQLFGLRESTWELRTLTGMLAGFAGVWLVYPRLDEAVASGARRSATRRPRRAVADLPGPARESASGAPSLVADGQ